MNQLQIFSYNDSPIQFEVIDGTVMANATLMCQPFNKIPNDIFKTKAWKEFELAVCEEMNLCSEDIRFTRKGNSSDFEQGTWIHQELVIELARRLDAKFALWCNRKVADLLRTGKAEIVANAGIVVPDFTDPVAAARAWADQAEARRLAEQQAAQNLQLAQRNAHKAAYVDQVLSSDSGWTTTTIAKELGVSAQRLNRFLIEKGVQFHIDGHYVLYAKHQDKEYTTTRTYAKDGKTFITTLWTEKGRAMINYLWHGEQLREQANQVLLGKGKVS